MGEDIYVWKKRPRIAYSERIGDLRAAGDIACYAVHNMSLLDTARPHSSGDASSLDYVKNCQPLDLVVNKPSTAGSAPPPRASPEPVHSDIAGDIGIDSSTLCLSALPGRSSPLLNVQESVLCSAEETARERRRRQKLPNKEHLFCAVCGDKANGHNFGAITCESCKAFFRRNALKNKELKCNFDMTCKIDHFTRKFCTACRLKKCFECDMRKEWILDEDSLKKRKKLTRKQREEQMKDAFQMPKAVSMAADSTQGGSADTSSHDSYGGSDVSADDLPVPLQEKDHQELTRIMENHSLIDQPKDLPKATTCTGPPPLGPVAMPTSQPTDVTADRMFTVSPTDLSKFADVSAKPHDVINLADNFIRRLIKFVKTLPEYRQLSSEDQIYLLKGGIMETLVIRSAIMYDPSINGFQVSTPQAKNEIKLSVISQGMGNEIYNEHVKFITSFNAIAKWDKPTMVLSMIINIFSSDRAGLQNKELVCMAEEHYSHLLQEYLRSRYSLHEARSIYPKLLLKLTDVRNYGEMSAQHIAKVTPENMEPLMREIFSMK